MLNKIAVIALVIILGFVNWSIIGREKQLTSGRVVYLELAPVDPRSLMQGDYMALRFDVANDVYDALPKSDDYRRWRHDVEASDGFAVVSLDEKNIATFKSIYTGQPLADNEILMKYRVRSGAVKFATNAFFFQEGQGDVYQAAKYGEFRVDKKGELLLVSMYDKDLKKLGK